MNAFMRTIISSTETRLQKMQNILLSVNSSEMTEETKKAVLEELIIAFFTEVDNNLELLKIEKEEVV